MSAVHAQVIPEAGGWSVFIPGLPVAATGTSFDDAIDEMIDALREYAGRSWGGPAAPRTSWPAGLG